MFKKRNILIYIAIIIIFLLIGASNFFFASTSYHFIIDPETMERTGGRYWVGDIDGMLMALALCVFVTGIWIPACYFGKMDKFVDHLTGRIEYYRRYIFDNWKKLLLHLCIIIAIGLVATVTAWLYSRYSFVSRYGLIRRISFFTTIGVSVYLILLFRQKPEKLFLSLSLLIGFMYVFAHPLLFFGLDNEMHFAWAVEESFLFNVSVVEADYKLAHSFQHAPFSSLPSGELNAVVYSFQKGTESLTWVDFSDVRHLYSRLAYMPMGLALYFGRSLLMSPDIIVKLGMLCNHFIYVLVVYFAIKRLNSGKYLMAVIAMLPTNFITSAAYGYDAWLVSFLMLGFAYCYNEIKTPERKVELKNLLIMTGAFFLAFVPKPVYFPVMFILYCIRKEKFKTAKGYKLYLAAITCTIVFVVASFIVPFLLSGGEGYSDERGDNNVSSMAQTLFILQNPITYTGILLNFLKDYLNIFKDGWFLSWFGSYWVFSFPNAMWLFLIFVTVTDRNPVTDLVPTTWQRLVTAFTIFFTIVLFSTSMYIGFTELGATHIAGVQKRYLIPFLFPFFYLVCSLRMENKINKTAYSSGIFGFMSFVLLYGAWNSFIT